MNHYRITKYNPDHRDANGHYTLDEWTYYDQVSDEFAQVKVTQKEYKKTEDCYVNTLVDTINAAKITKLMMKDYYGTSIPDHLRDFDAIELSQLKELGAGKWFNITQLQPIFRLSLRELVDCRLYYPWKFYIHFGWDYYMYIGTSLNYWAVMEIARKHGLYAEEFRSPYLESSR
jgi:hypothetical protein